MDQSVQYRDPAQPRELSTMDRERRFGGLVRLYGEAGALRLRDAHVCVVGIGGVGSWSAEAVARSGVGAMTLIDLDMVAESNTNRQIHALGDNYGKAKVDAMAERIAEINPDCRVRVVEDFVTPENAPRLLNGDFSAVIDAIDQVKAKAAMVEYCKRNSTPLVCVGAAGGQTDPTRVVRGDLAQTIQDPLLARLRSLLRRHHGFPRDSRKKFGITAVYSTEPLRYPDRGVACAADTAIAGLNCAGFGSSVCVTSVFGMVAAAHVLDLITSS